MKTIIEKSRWKEITTKVYNIKKISDKPFFKSSDKLIEYTKRLFKKGGTSYNNRMKCNCCKKLWSNDEPIYICFTDKENRLICENCKSKLTQGE